MTAHDRSHGSNGGRFPSDETLAILRDALARCLAGEIDESGVCDALGVLAREAQERQLRAEAMLIAFKRIWNEIPTTLEPRERQAMLDRLVRLCIDSYYKR